MNERAGHSSHKLFFIKGHNEKCSALRNGNNFDVKYKQGQPWLSLEERVCRKWNESLQISGIQPRIKPISVNAMTRTAKGTSLSFSAEGQSEARVQYECKNSTIDSKDTIYRLPHSGSLKVSSSRATHLQVQRSEHGDDLLRSSKKTPKNIPIATLSTRTRTVHPSKRILSSSDVQPNQFRYGGTSVATKSNASTTRLKKNKSNEEVKCTKTGLRKSGTPLSQMIKVTRLAANSQSSTLLLTNTSASAKSRLAMKKSTNSNTRLPIKKKIYGCANGCKELTDHAPEQAEPGMVSNDQEKYNTTCTSDSTKLNFALEVLKRCVSPDVVISTDNVIIVNFNKPSETEASMGNTPSLFVTNICN